MEDLKLDIIRRKKLDRSAVIYGLLAGILIVNSLLQYFQIGKFRFIEEFARQLGLMNWLTPITIMYFIVFGIVFLRGLLTIFRKKKRVGGELILDHNNLNIKKGNQNYLLSGNELQHLKFELKSPSPQQAPLSGGNWVKIPSPDGTFRCEFDVCDQKSFDALKDYINHFQSVHQVKIEIAETTDS